VPNCAIGAVDMVLSRMRFEVSVVLPRIAMSPAMSSFDFGDVLPIPMFPLCNIQKSMRFEVLLSILKMPLLLIKFQLL
jgi:hypothetical protein